MLVIGHCILTSSNTSLPVNGGKLYECLFFEMRVSADLKRLILGQASAYDMTITEYVAMLVHRDVGG